MLCLCCLKEPLPNLYPETPTPPSNITFYMNSGSYSKALSGNSQQQNNCFIIPSTGSSHSTPEQHEILANIGGFQTGDHDFSAWREGRNEVLVWQPMDGQNAQGHGLSLSLGTQIPSGIQMPPIHDRNHNSCFDSFLGTNPSISGNGAYKSRSSRDECVRNSENIPPDLYRGDISLHGMSSVGRTVPNSKYLKAAQQLLDEVVDIRKAVKLPDMKNSTNEDSMKSSKEEDGRFENDRPSTNGVPNYQGSASNFSCELSHAEKQDLRNKLTKLLSMLDEVNVM